MSATQKSVPRNEGISMPFPISPDYVKKWTTPRAIVELIANALDEDSEAAVSWAEGVLTIEDRGPGIAQDAFVLGASSKTSQQIGQFGEGKKLAALVLARDPEIGEIWFETVGYTFTPSIENRSPLDGIVPMRGEKGAATLVYTLYPGERTTGTKITIQCPKRVADDAVARVLHLAQPGYIPPQDQARVMLDGPPGRIFIGGILVSTDPRLSASYDLPLGLAKGDQNRDRTIVDGSALDHYLIQALAGCSDPHVIDHFVTLALARKPITPQEQYFGKVSDYNVKLAFLSAARRAFPAGVRLYYSDGNENVEGRAGMEDGAWLLDRGVLMVETELPPYQHRSLMELLGVERRHTAVKTETRRRESKTAWVPVGSLAAAQLQNLDYAVALFRATLGPESIGKVRAYSQSEDIGCGSAGKYYTGTDVIGLHQKTLTDRQATIATLVHEAAHRKAYFEQSTYSDRSSGFEKALEEIGAKLLSLCMTLADGKLVLELTEPTAWEGTVLPPGSRLTSPKDRTPAVKPNRKAIERSKLLHVAPEPRRLLAELLHARMDQHRASTGLSVTRLMAGIALQPTYWNVLDCPHPVGWRKSQGVSCVIDYDKITAIAGLVGLNPGVVWLAHMAPEAPTYNRCKPEDKNRPWSIVLRKPLARALADLERAGGVYVEQIPLFRAMADGQTHYDADGTWLQPVLALLHAEAERLR
ncbi:hypothetical protein ACFC58_38085 [Kitasatospora purpeofusca]|uniref:hypothetical protein n=1 Tax=Kitasatospora purpeofusca TaxID=67352 RepID=UPI0035DA873F